MTPQEYTQAFKRRMYGHIKEDFEDSFTPGGAGPHKRKKPVMIPMTYFREKAWIVSEELSLEGKRKPVGLNIDQLAKELFAEGGSEAGEYLSNPSTPKIPAEMFEDFKFFDEFFGKDSLKANPIKAADPSELMRQFKSSMMHVTMLYMRQRLKLAPEDFEFQSGASDLDQRRVLANQYRRYFMSLVVANMMRKVYEVTPSDIDEFLKLIGFESKPTRVLKLPLIRRQFSKGITFIMDRIFGKLNLGQQILSQVRSVGNEKRLK